MTFYRFIKFIWQLFSLGDLSRLEIISPTAAGSFLDRFLSDKEAGVHHITLQTPDIRQAMAHLEANGIPYFGFNEYPEGIWTEIFIHPRHAFGVLIQIAQFQSNDWLATQVKLPPETKWRMEKTPGGATLTFAHPGDGKVSMELESDEIKLLKTSLEEILL